MADDWIKFRKCVLTHPRLVRTMSALNADKLRTLGGILSAWCLLDEQTQDGNLEGYTPEFLDQTVGLPGLARAMEAAGWLVITENGLQAPEFEKHNGATAKRRAAESRRKMSARNADKCPQTDGTNPGQNAHLKKRREYTPLTPQGGDARAHPPARETRGKPTDAGLTGIDEEWLDCLRTNSNYARLDVDHELAKCAAWCDVNGKRLDRRRFINWLNGAHTPITPPPTREHTTI